MNRVPPIRCGFSRRPLLAALPVVLLLPFLAGALLSESDEPLDVEPLTVRVSRQDFLHDISVRGQLESGANVEVACEARTRRGFGWFRILEVVDEGTYVQPGDFLIRLDSSGLETERNRQQIICEQAKAAAAQARAKYEIAQSAEQQYLKGEYALEKQKAELAIFVAKDKESRAREYKEASRKLFAQGYITEKQFQADEFAWQSAKTELSLAETRLSTLENYTKRKKLTQLQSDLVVSKARLKSTEYTCKMELANLADVEEQIKKCVIVAPVAGEVVLAHMYHNDHAHLVAPGEETMEKRVLVRLPDPSHMQVKAKIEEEKIAQVRVGQPVTIELEAFPGMELHGRVSRVAEYPEADDWHGSGVKQYETIIRIDTPMSSLRPGLTAEAKIRIHQMSGQLQLPCQAVLRHGDKSYCICYDGDRLEAREVGVGPNNGQTVVIREGVEEGEQVVLGAAGYRKKVALPTLAPQKLRSPLAYHAR